MALIAQTLSSLQAYQVTRKWSPDGQEFPLGSKFLQTVSPRLQQAVEGPLSLWGKGWENVHIGLEKAADDFTFRCYWRPRAYLRQHLPKTGGFSAPLPLYLPHPGPSHTLPLKNLLNYNLSPPQIGTLTLLNVPLSH